ncbi:MAG: L-serine ammonia-lyase [Ignavibacteriales bacterium]|nr:L-serine ammonia-lyase [Ignavibacteriales bacterium]
MKSIKQIYKIGKGPSASHTMAPFKAATIFKERTPDAEKYSVILFGSVAATGKGHQTDIAILEAFSPKNVEIIWQPETFYPKHPNTLKFIAYSKDDKIISEWIVYSIGGGDLEDDTDFFKTKDIYEFSTMNDILNWCGENGKNIWEYVNEREKSDIWDYLSEVWKVMKKAVKQGIEEEGTLPGGLNLRRKASSYFIRASGLRGSLKRRSLVFAYALAVSEQNASGGMVVTAPTCGSCGVIPAVLYMMEEYQKFSDIKILRALATAGLIGNLIKVNASVSGAEVGCQGEIGTACAMAAGALTQLFGGTPPQVEYAAEMGLEHHLGLTCDPVGGLVQVPCIERNAFAASRALDANTYAILSDGTHRVSFDKVVKTMKQTGHDLPNLYKETSTGGLAINIKIK